MHARRHQPIGLRCLDRLSLVGAALLLSTTALSCERGKDGAGPEAQKTQTSRSRVNAVQAAEEDKVSPAEFCDVMPAAADAPTLELPPLAGDATLERPSSWMWLNVWATWCKPCIEEIPLLTRATADIEKAGVRVRLQFLSADETDEQVAEFQKKHPELGSSLRLADPESLEEWMTGLGVTGATLPIHVLTDPDGRVRCVRASAIEERDLEGARALLAP